MTLSMENRVALITGAASGMGEAVARKFLDLGCKVVGFSLEEKSNVEHENFIYVQGDITSYEDCQKAADFVVEKFGKLDSLVHCAGIVNEGTLESTSVEMFERVMKINAFGTFNICKAAISHLKKQKSNIVNISSDMSVKPLQERIAYNPSKAAVNMLTKCIAVEYAPMVRCNSVLPGIIHTPMIQKRLDACEDPEQLLAMYRELYPMGRIGTTEDIVNGVVFLSTEQSDWITGIELPICGGPL